MINIEHIIPLLQNPRFKIGPSDVETSSRRLQVKLDGKITHRPVALRGYAYLLFILAPWREVPPVTGASQNTRYKDPQLPDLAPWRETTETAP